MWHLSQCQLYPAPGLAKGFQQGVGSLVGVVQTGVLLARHAVEWTPWLQIFSLASEVFYPPSRGGD